MNILLRGHEQVQHHTFETANDVLNYEVFGTGLLGRDRRRPKQYRANLNRKRRLLCIRQIHVRNCADKFDESLGNGGDVKRMSAVANRTVATMMFVTMIKVMEVEISSDSNEQPN